MAGIAPALRLPGVLLLVLWPVAAVDIYTPGSLEALNGTDVRLKCTFQSNYPVERLTVNWQFRPEATDQDEFVFHFNEEPYPPSKGRFSGRVTWDGDTMRNDVSIMLWNVNPSDNGTFLCQVTNPPDVDGTVGKIKLTVVLRVNFSEMHILALTVGSACALMILVVIVVVTCRHRWRKQQEKKTEVVEMELMKEEKPKKAKEEETSLALGEA